MTNEEKAREIVKEVSTWPNLFEYEAMTSCAERAMKWKDEQFAEEKYQLQTLINVLKKNTIDINNLKQQWIKKACERLKSVGEYYIRHINNGTLTLDDFIDDFKFTLEDKL